MPVRKVKGGYRWGKSGKIYKIEKLQSGKAEQFMLLGMERNVAAKRRGKKRDPRLKEAGVSGFNKPKRTPGHPKSHTLLWQK